MMCYIASHKSWTYARSDLAVKDLPRIAGRRQQSLRVEALKIEDLHFDDLRHESRSQLREVAGELHEVLSVMRTSR